MGLITHLLFWPVTGPIAGIKWTLGKVSQVAEEELTDDTPIKNELMELQMQLELGDIDDDEYVRREAELMVRLREVRAWRERLGKGVSGGPVKVSSPQSGRPTAAKTARQPGTRTAGVNALVDSLPRVTLVLGKGGVGKTTCASALALLSARRIGPTLVLTTDPAHALPTVLEQEIGSSPTAVGGEPRLSAQLLDASTLRSTFMERWGDVIRKILDRGTYLDDSDIGPLVDTAMPGSDEIFAALALAELMARPGPFARVVVDTAPTGHTLRLFSLPKTFRALVRLLDSMQAKHRFMVRTLTRAYRGDDADAFLTEMSGLVDSLERSLTDPGQSAAVMVTNPETLVREETERYLSALDELHIHVAAVVWNATDELIAPIGNAPQYRVPVLKRWPTGTKGLERWLDAVTEARRVEKGSVSTARSAPREALLTHDAPSAPRFPLPSLTIVAGKGGVGKTTVACALAIGAATSRRTLIVSTDPAPSLADALAQPVPDADTAVSAMPSLFARQMDASAAFARLRDEYRERVDALFQGLVSSGVDLSHDRAIVRDLLALAPPGVDEVYALSLLADALFKDHYDCVVVDPAPTGHLLRLLEMPKLALAWSHQLLRLMLKYKEVAGLGETARDLLEFSKSLRALDALLLDAEKCGVVLVTLDQPVVRSETERLAKAIRAREVAVSGVVLNRVSGRSALPVADAALHFEAPLIEPPPVGVPAIRQWAASWTALETQDAR